MTTVADPSADAPNCYCSVSIVRGSRVVDVALPLSVPLADLIPGVVRMILPPGATHPTDGHPADDGGDDAPAWVLTPIGRAALNPAETLTAADIVDGDLLMLTDAGDIREQVPTAATVRDALEDRVESRHAFWDAGSTARWCWWCAIVALVALLVPVGQLEKSAPAMIVGALSAMIAGVVAVLAGRNAESVCATAALGTACVHAGLAGTVITERLWAHHPGTPELVTLPALAAALPAAAVVALGWRPATVMVVALVTLLLPATVVAALRMAGADPAAGSLAVAVAVTVLLGALPRLVLAVTGLPAADPGRSEFARRVQFAERMLIGCLLGASGAVLAAVIPPAALGDLGSRWLAFGIGCLLVLRARAFGQVCHAIGPRIAGALVIGVVWSGFYASEPSSRLELLLAAVVSLGAVSLVVTPHRADRRGPVTAARAGRALAALESVLVVSLLVGTAGELGLTGWALSVLG